MRIWRGFLKNLWSRIKGFSKEDEIALLQIINSKMNTGVFNFENIKKPKAVLRHALRYPLLMLWRDYLRVGLIELKKRK